MEDIAFILSLVGLASVVLSYLMKGKNMILILILLFLGNFFIGLSYLFSGNMSGAGSCFVGAAQCLINFGFESKGKDIPKWLVAIYAAAFLTVNLIVFSGPTDILIIVASMLFIMCILQKNGKKYRLWTLFNVVLWVIYDLIKGAHGPLVTHLIQLGSTVSGIVIHDIRKTKPFTESDGK